MWHRIAFSGIAALAFLLAAPALPGRAAAPSPCQGSSTAFLDMVITVWQPDSQASAGEARQCTPSSGSTLTGSWSVRIDAASIGSLKSFVVSIVPADGSIPALPPEATVARNYPAALLPGSKIQDSIETTWDTASLTRYNSVYNISATAVSLIGSRVSALVSNLQVSNPPSQPTGVAATLDGVVPVVTWAQNPEPDITAYQVRRSIGGGSYTLLTTGPGTSYRDSAAPLGGAITYQVVAVRRSPVEQNGILSAASIASAAVTPALPAIAPVAPVAPFSPPAFPRVAVKAPPAAAAPPGPENTFAPTLPFAQPIPQATIPAFPDIGPKALGPAHGYASTTLVQKVRYLAAAALLVIASVFIIRFARKLARTA